MGASESVHVTSQERTLYENQECLSKFSSDLHTDVLRLYQAMSTAVKITGFQGDNGNEVYLYVVILVNPNKRNQCFNLYCSVHQDEAEEKFQ